MQDPDEALWSSWTSTKTASITIDGQKINDIFTAIGKQLDWLRRQSSSLKESIEQIGTGVGTNTNLSAELDAIKQTIIDVENLVYSNENKNKNKIEDLQMQIIKLQDHNKATDKKLTEHTQKLSQLENSFANQLLELKDSFNDHVRSSMSQNKEFSANIASQRDVLNNHTSRLEVIEANVTSNKDTIAINEFRQKASDAKLVDLTEQLAHYKMIVNEFPARYIDRINSALADLYGAKADRLDLDRKADTELLLMKADLSEISRLEDISDEIHRRLTQQAKEVGEGFNTLDAKIDKKSEKIAMWCLKNLRKELKRGSLDVGDTHDGGDTHYSHHRGDGFGDIGRIKCLVCDQTIKQPYLAETGFGPAGMNNTIRPQHRSNSPPPADKRPGTAERTGRSGRENNSNHKNNVYTASAMANTGQSSPVLPNVSGPPVQYSNTMSSPVKMNGRPAQQHSKLVKMHNRPNEAGAVNLTLNSEVEDPDYVVDFKYRMSGVGQPSNNEGTGGMGPIVNGLKASASTPNGLSQTNNGLHGAPTRYFKDLEE